MACTRAVPPHVVGCIVALADLDKCCLNKGISRKSITRWRQDGGRSGTLSAIDQDPVQQCC